MSQSKSLSARWARLSDRLAAWRAGRGGDASAIVSQPEPRSIGYLARGRQLCAGNFVFAGHLVEAPDTPIWDISAPDAAFAAEMHGFGWLDDLAAAGDAAARARAQEWLMEWIARYGRGHGPGWTADLAGRRLIRWISHALFLMRGQTAEQSEAFLRALARQARHLPVDEVAGLFTSAAFVSFGGAYALLPYVAEQAVETYGWLSAEQMLNGLALAEATPGPLILVNTYAGFFAGWPGDGVATAVLATFFTFAPSFTLILAGAPYVEALAGRRWIRRALAGVSAAVVGVILNLALYLGMAALFPDGLAAPEWPKIALLAGFAALALGWRGVPMQVLVAGGAGAGLALHALGLIG